MKKLLLGLGTIAAVTAPVVSVVACSDKDSTNKLIDSALIQPPIISPSPEVDGHDQEQPWVKEFDFQDYAGYNYKIKSRADIDKIQFRVMGSMNVNNHYFFTNLKFTNEVWKTEKDATAYITFVRNFIISYWEDGSNFVKGEKSINHSLTNLLTPFWGKEIKTEGVV